MGPVSTGAVVCDGLPTEKVKAPDTGWLSADTTRQATVYVPSPSSPGNATLAVSDRPSACPAAPVRTR
ncbi:hypothetical protein GCM10023257_23830 [Streptomyces hyderabadensis]|uniref:Uncharacterized protein n=1 Tax=Streptomyces hyderabadensis TaxID=598549 RepID=A0ABP9I0C6_9ACTN